MISTVVIGTMKNASEFQTLRDMSGLIRDGESLNGQICPWCEGGDSKEKSLSVTLNTGSILYNCHRASCGHRGAIPLTAGEMREINREATPKKKAKQPEELLALGDMTKRLLMEKYELGDIHLKMMGASWDPLSSRLYLPLINWNRTGMIGYALRSLSGASPKSIIRLTEPDQPCLAFYGPSTTKGVVFIVEDQFSASKISRYGTGVALMGTAMNPSKAMLIKKNLDPRLVVLALDKDAVDKAVQHWTRYRAVFPNTRVMALERDIKDTKYADLDELVRRVTKEDDGQSRKQAAGGVS